MRLLHYAGCLFRAVKVIPFVIIFSAIVTVGMLEGGEQFRLFLEEPRFRWFLLAFVGIFLLGIASGLRKRTRQMGCAVTFLAIGPFVVVGAILGYLVSVIVLVARGAGPAVESASTLGRFWRTFIAFPAATRIPTLVGAISGFIGLVGETDSDSDSFD